MFKALREKFSGWLKKKDEKEEKVVEKPKKEDKAGGGAAHPKVKKDKIKEKKDDLRDAEEKVVEEKLKEKSDKIKEEVLLKFEVGKQKFEPDVEKIKEKLKAKEEVLKEVVPGEPEEIKEEEEKGFFFKIKRKLLTSVLKQDEFDESFEELEMTLLENNVALEVVDRIKKRLSEDLVDTPIKKSDIEKTIVGSLKNAVLEVLVEQEESLDEKIKKSVGPYVILFFGINGSGKCVHGKSNVQMGNGEIAKAKDLYGRYAEKLVEENLEDGKIIDVSGEDILVPSFNPKTLKIENKKVTHLWKLDKKELIEVKLDNGNDYSVKVTPEHPFFVLRNGSVVKVRADEILESDYVAVPRDIEIGGKTQLLFDDIRNLDLYAYVSPEEARKNILSKHKTLKDAHSSLKFKKNYCWFTGDVKRGKIPIEFVDGKEYNFLRIKGKLDKKPITFPLFLSSEFAEFIGYIIGDGRLEKGYVEITNENPEVISRFSELSKMLFNITPAIRKDERTRKMFKVILGSRTLVDMLKIFGLRPGRKGKELKVPQQVLLSDNDVVESFIRAYFDCDSWVARNQRTIELTSENKIMMQQISMLLKRFGIISTIFSKRINNNGYWRLSIRSRYAEKYFEKIGFLVKQKKERARRYGNIGLLQKCGKQDMIPLGKSLKLLRNLLGFSIAEIQKFVGGYRLYENMGSISREKLSELVGVYQNRKSGVFLRAMTHIFNKHDLREIFSSYSLNGIVSHLGDQDCVVSDDKQVLLTKKGEKYLEEMRNNNNLARILLEKFAFLSCSNVCWIPVSMVNRICNDEKQVYDLTVEDNHSFIADGFVVHNTTSIAKLAWKLKKEGKKVVLGAADTFRAASIEQLEEHAKKIGVPIVKSQYQADPASVAFDAVKYAEKHKADVALIDTAGRMYTKANLMKEMKKIVRVAKPHLKVFVGESITGNDAVEQAKTFNETVGIDGIILTKADVDEKAGTILSASFVTGKPILFLGTGQGMEDLKEFRKRDVLKNLGLEQKRKF